MEKLLKWSLNASNPENSPEGTVKPPDPELLNQLFGGPDDAQLMQQAVAVAVNPEAELEQRETALDNLEMLIENLDNANNLENLKLWPGIIGLLDDDEAVIRRMACWVIGTAVQNNEKSQTSFCNQNNPSGISKLVQLAETDNDPAVRVKALYALSSVVSHHEQAYDLFDTHGGWSSLEKSLEEEITQIKALTLLNTIFMTDPIDLKFPKLRDSELVPAVLNVAQETDNLTAQEKALQLLWGLKNNGFPFSNEEHSDILTHRQKLIDKGSIEDIDYPLN